MNSLKRAVYSSFYCRKVFRVNLCSPLNTFSTESNNVVKGELAEKEIKNRPYLHRNLEFMIKYDKPREVWVENFDTIKEEKRGLVELHPKIFGTIPRLDLIFDNIRWQNLYNTVCLFNVKTRAEKRGGGRKPHKQKTLGKARQGSIRAPHLKGGGSCHGPRDPTSYFYMLPFYTRVHGLTSTLSAKFAQDDLHVIENIDIPTEDSQFILDLIKERNWGPSVLIVDVEDVMPRNITVATEPIEHVNLMPVYGLNVYSMLKYNTLVLTLAAVDEIEKKLLGVLHTANSVKLIQKFSKIHFLDKDF